MAVECVGLISGLTPERAEFTFKLSFLHDDVFEQLEKFYVDQTVFKMKVSKTRGELKTTQQLKRIWSMFERIVVFVGEPMTRENVLAIHDYCLQNLFPRKTIVNDVINKATTHLGNIEFSEPIRLSDQTIEELTISMQKISETWPEAFAGWGN